MVIFSPVQWEIFGCGTSLCLLLNCKSVSSYLSTESNCFLSLACVLCCSDDEDDTAELLAELQRIKKERAQEEARKVWFLLVSAWRWLWFIHSYCSMLLFHAMILSCVCLACFDSCTCSPEFHHASMPTLPYYLGVIQMESFLLVFCMGHQISLIQRKMPILPDFWPLWNKK